MREIQWTNSISCFIFVWFLWIKIFSVVAYWSWNFYFPENIKLVFFSWWTSWIRLTILNLVIHKLQRKSSNATCASSILTTTTTVVSLSNATQPSRRLLGMNRSLCWRPVTLSTIRLWARVPPATWSLAETAACVRRWSVLEVCAAFSTTSSGCAINAVRLMNTRASSPMKSGLESKSLLNSKNDSSSFEFLIEKGKYLWCSYFNKLN